MKTGSAEGDGFGCGALRRSAERSRRRWVAARRSEMSWRRRRSVRSASRLRWRRRMAVDGGVRGAVVSSSTRWSRRSIASRRPGRTDCGGEAGVALAGLEKMKAAWRGGRGCERTSTRSSMRCWAAVMSLGGGGRGGGAEVGDEVGDGEVSLVSDGRDDGEIGGGDDAGEGFVVEGRRGLRWSRRRER